MKNVFVLLFASSMLALGFSSCKDVLDVERDFSFTYELEVESEEFTYFSIDLINVENKVDVISDYGDKIKEIDIKNIDFWIKNHQGPADQLIVQADVTIANPDGTDPILIASLENQSIASLVQNPTSLELNEAGVKKLNQLIRQAPHSLQIVLNGQLDQPPSIFTAVFDFEGKMVANPL